ncbi:uncharacterized protein [Aegilops tauschii subsp. strangulata]|nr:uncharacterized protein LOC109761182 isoform X2 [Aegilops tauschii subsp. strangulata]XP_044419348.1 uncharacterized protein LOC123144317 isoform X1 [Triticum aestivum]
MPPPHAGCLASPAGPTPGGLPPICRLPIDECQRPTPRLRRLPPRPSSPITGSIPRSKVPLVSGSGRSRRHRRELWRRKQSNMKSFCSGRLVRRLGFGVKQSEVYEPGGDDCRIPVIECVYEWIQVLEILGVILVPENNSLRSVGWTSGAETPGDVSKSVLHNKGALRMMAFMLVWMMLVR